MSDIVERLRYAATSRPGGICEEAADEIERLRETVKNLRESAKLRVQYHAAELADVAAERDVAREEVARLKDARVQFSGADAAEIERLRDQLHLAEVARAAQVEGVVQAAAGWRERANQLELQVAALREPLMVRASLAAPS